MKLKMLVILIFSIGLMSCSEPQSETEKVTNKEDSPPKHMLSEQQKMIQKAKDAEKLVKEADEKRRQALKDQGG